MNRLGELIDDDIKNVSNALISAAPKIASIEGSGISPELSISRDVMQAINILANIVGFATQSKESAFSPHCVSG